MSRQDKHQTPPVSGDSPSDVLAGLVDDRIRRSDFLAGAGKFAAGAFGMTGLGGLLAACGSSSSSSSGSGSSAGSSGKVEKIAVIEQAFSPFLTESFQNPLAKYLASPQSGGSASTTHSLPGWSYTFGNENNTVPTGIGLLNEYVAANDGVLILSTGDEMTAWEHAVKQATSQGAIFIRPTRTTSGNSIVQANWGTFFPASMTLMAKDAITKATMEGGKRVL